MKNFFRKVIPAILLPCSFFLVACGGGDPGGNGPGGPDGDGGEDVPVRVDTSFNTGYTEFANTVEKIKASYDTAPEETVASRREQNVFGGQKPPAVNFNSADLESIKTALQNAEKEGTELNYYYGYGIDIATSSAIFSGYAMAKKFHETNFYDINIKMEDRPAVEVGDTYFNLLTTKTGNVMESYIYFGTGDFMSISKAYTYSRIEYTSEEDFSFFGMDYTYSYANPTEVDSQYVVYGTSAGDFYMVMIDYAKPEHSMAFYSESKTSPAYTVSLSDSETFTAVNGIMEDKFLNLIDREYMDSLKGTEDFTITYDEQVQAMRELGWTDEASEEEVQFGWSANRTSNSALGYQSAAQYWARTNEDVGTLSIPTEYKYLNDVMYITADGVDTLFIPKEIKGIVGISKWWSYSPEYEILKKIMGRDDYVIGTDAEVRKYYAWDEDHPIEPSDRRLQLRGLEDFSIRLYSQKYSEYYRLKHIVVEEGSTAFTTDDWGNLWSLDEHGEKQYLLYLVEEPKSPSVDTLTIPLGEGKYSYDVYEPMEFIDFAAFKNRVKHIVFDVGNDIKNIMETLPLLRAHELGSNTWDLESITFINVPEDQEYTEVWYGPDGEPNEGMTISVPFELGAMFTSYGRDYEIEGGFRPKKVIFQGDFNDLSVTNFRNKNGTQEFTWAVDDIEFRNSDGTPNTNARFTSESRLSTIREVEIRQEAGDEVAKAYAVRYYTGSGDNKTYYYKKPSGAYEVEKTWIDPTKYSAQYPIVYKVTIKDGVKNLDDFGINDYPLSFGSDMTEWVVEDAYDIETSYLMITVNTLTANCSRFEYAYTLTVPNFLGMLDEGYGGVRNTTFGKEDTANQKEMLRTFKSVYYNPGSGSGAEINVRATDYTSGGNYTLTEAQVNLVKNAFAEGGVTNIHFICFDITTSGTIYLPKEKPEYLMFICSRQTVHSPKIVYAGTKEEFLTNYCSSGFNVLEDYYYLAEKIECTNGSYTLQNKDITVSYENEYIAFEYTTNTHKLYYDSMPNYEGGKDQKEKLDLSVGTIKLTFKGLEDPSTGLDYVLTKKLAENGMIADFAPDYSFESFLMENGYSMQSSYMVSYNAHKLEVRLSIKYDHDKSPETEKITILEDVKIDILNGTNLPDGYTIS